MPWKSVEQLPARLREAIADYSDTEKELWLEVVNRCLERDDADEGACIAAAHEAVKLHREGYENAGLVDNSELDGSAPEWVELAQIGVWLGNPQRPEVITPRHLESALSNFERHQAAANNDVCIDYHHQTSLAKMNPGPSAPAAGWVQEMELRNGGRSLWGKVDWTDRAEDLIENGEYRYLSPVLAFEAPDRVSGAPQHMQLQCAALTNTPFMTSLAALNEDRIDNDTDTNGGMDAAGERAREGIFTGGEDMTILEKLAELRDQDPAEVADALGLEAGADADDDDVLEALSGLPDELNELKGELEEQQPVSEPVANALDLDADTDQRGVLTAIGRMQMESDMSPVANALDLGADADVDDMVEAIEALTSQHQENEAQNLVENAVEAGKVSPAKKDFLLRLAQTDMEAAREVINSMPSQVDLQGDDKEPKNGSRPTLTDTEHSVCGQLGVSEEEYARV